MARPTDIITDYEQTSKYFFHLADVRFKLLALVPSIAGIAVAFLGKAGMGAQAFVIGIFGFIVTVGVIMYDQRNTQIYDTMVRRLKRIEAHMDMELVQNGADHGGPFLDRPGRSYRLFGILMWHDRGLTIIYSAAISAWTYLIVYGFIDILALSSTKLKIVVSLVLAVIVFLLFFKQLIRNDHPTDTHQSQPKD